MTMGHQVETTERPSKGGEISEETRLPLKLVVSIVAGAVALVLSYGTLKLELFSTNAKVETVNKRVDGVEARLGRIERTNCAIAAKLGIFSADCGAIGGPGGGP